MGYLLNSSTLYSISIASMPKTYRIIPNNQNPAPQRGALGAHSLKSHIRETQVGGEIPTCSLSTPGGRSVLAAIRP